MAGYERERVSSDYETRVPTWIEAEERDGMGGEGGMGGKGHDGREKDGMKWEEDGMEGGGRDGKRGEGWDGK